MTTNTAAVKQSVTEEILSVESRAAFIEQNEQQKREADQFIRDREALQNPPVADVLEAHAEGQIEEHLFHYHQTAKNPEAAIKRYAKTIGMDGDLAVELADKIARRRGKQTLRQRRSQEIRQELERILLIEDSFEREYEKCHLAKTTKFGRKQLDTLENLLAQVDTPANFVSLDELIAKAPDKPDWLIEGKVPGGSTMLIYADGGVGKTALAYDIALSVASGRDWSGFKTKQAPVLVIQTDEPASISGQNFKAMCCVEGLPIKFSEFWSFNQLATLRREIQQTQTKLVVIDSWTSVMRLSGVEEKDTQYGAPLYQLRDIAAQEGCTIIVLHHENKAGGIRGTTALRNNVSEVWRLKRDSNFLGDKECHRLLDVQKSRSGSLAVFEVARDPDDGTWEFLGDFDPDGMAQDNADGGVLSLSDEVFGYLNIDKGRRYSCQELVNATGKSKAGVAKVLEKLCRTGLITFEWVRTEAKKPTKYYYVEGGDSWNKSTVDLIVESEGVDLIRDGSNSVTEGVGNKSTDESENKSTVDLIGVDLIGQVSDLLNWLACRLEDCPETSLVGQSVELPEASISQGRVWTSGEGFGPSREVASQVADSFDEIDWDAIETKNLREGYGDESEQDYDIFNLGLAKPESYFGQTHEEVMADLDKLAVVRVEDYPYEIGRVVRVKQDDVPKKDWVVGVVLSYNNDCSEVKLNVTKTGISKWVKVEDCGE